MEVKELTFSCCTWPSMPWNSTVSTLSSQGPRRAEPRLPLSAHAATGLCRAGNASAGNASHPWRLWCHPEPCWWGLSSASWLLCVPGAFLPDGARMEPSSCHLQPGLLGQLGAGCALQVCLWTGKVWGLLRVVSLFPPKSVQVVNSRSFLEQKPLLLKLVQPQKAIPLNRNYYYNINPPKHTQRTWFRTRQEQFILSLRGLEGWYLEQLVKQKCLAPGLALLFNDPLFMCHLSNPWRDRYKLYL